MTYYVGNVLVTEKNESTHWLTLLYTSLCGPALRYIMSQPWVARIAGIYNDSWLSKHHIASFCKQYNITLDDFVVPPGGYRSFNDFFTRKLKPGARAMDQTPTALVSPADSKLYVIPNISADTMFFIKQKALNLEQFLQDKQAAQAYTNGTMLVFRLAPYDYHRFHFPTDCIPSAAKKISGILESVNPLVFKTAVQPLLTNQRQLLYLKTKHFDTIAMVAVGAMMVGTIIDSYTPDIMHKKGDQAGYFAFGGSTVVLLFKQGCITIAPEIVKHSLAGYETAVLVGQRITE